MAKPREDVDWRMKDLSQSKLGRRVERCPWESLSWSQTRMSPRTENLQRQLTFSRAPICQLAHTLQDAEEPSDNELKDDPIEFSQDEPRPTSSRSPSTPAVNKQTRRSLTDIRKTIKETAIWRNASPISSSTSSADREPITIPTPFQWQLPGDGFTSAERTLPPKSISGKSHWSGSICSKYEPPSTTSMLVLAPTSTMPVSPSDVEDVDPIETTDSPIRARPVRNRSGPSRQCLASILFPPRGSSELVEDVADEPIRGHLGQNRREIRPI